MTVQAAVYGRLGRDAVVSRTANDKVMARCSLAVDVTAHGAEAQETEWVSVLAFAHAAHDLGRCKRGDMISVSGRLTRSRWTGKDGLERSGWSLLADGVISARTVRPSGRRPAPA
jgi:single-strand DNA-binding protein